MKGFKIVLLLLSYCVVFMGGAQLAIVNEAVERKVQEYRDSDKMAGISIAFMVDEFAYAVNPRQLSLANQLAVRRYRTELADE